MPSAWQSSTLAAPASSATRTPAASWTAISTAKESWHPVTLPTPGPRPRLCETCDGEHTRCHGRPQRSRALRDLLDASPRQGRIPTTTELTDETGMLRVGARRGDDGAGDERDTSCSTATTEIVLAHPFATRNFAFSVMGDHTLWWGGCAWDAFAIPNLVPDEPTALIATLVPGLRHGALVDGDGQRTARGIASGPLPDADGACVGRRHPHLREPAHLLRRDVRGPVARGDGQRTWCGVRPRHALAAGVAVVCGPARHAVPAPGAQRGPRVLRERRARRAVWDVGAAPLPGVDGSQAARVGDGAHVRVRTTTTRDAGSRLRHAGTHEQLVHVAVGGGAHQRAMHGGRHEDLGCHVGTGLGGADARSAVAHPARVTASATTDAAAVRRRGVVAVFMVPRCADRVCIRPRTVCSRYARYARVVDGRRGTANNAEHERGSLRPAHPRGGDAQPEGARGAFGAGAPRRPPGHDRRTRRRALG